MLKNYFKIAWRNLVKSKFYSALNIIGLTVGLAVGILILLWVNDELSFDKFHSKAEQIYRVNTQLGTGLSKGVYPILQAPIAVYGLKEVPGIQNAVRLTDNNDYTVLTYKEKQLEGNILVYTDPSLFKIFDYKLVEGDIDNPFPDEQSVVITEPAAKRFFGDEDPIGKVIVADGKTSFTISGVMADFPENSFLKCDILFSTELYKRKYTDAGTWKSMDEDWGNYAWTTFLQIQPGVSTKAIEAKLTQINIKHQPSLKAVDVGSYRLQPLLQTHLYAPDGSSSGIQTVKIFSIIAILILLIASINYINLSTARAMLRSKEISIRKIIGAERKQLIGQLVMETGLFFLIALILSFGLILLLLPSYNTITGKQMHFNMLDPGLWKIIGATVLTSLLASSIYPALLLSSFKPIDALKGKLSLGGGNATFRKILVVCQFVFSIGLIIGTLIINRQLRYIQQMELGYDKSYVFSFVMKNMQKDYAAIRSKLLSNPDIQGVTSATRNIVHVGGSTLDVDWEGKDPNISYFVHPMGIDKDFLPFFKMKMAGGTGFSGLNTDSLHFILNETAITEAGIKDPIGKRFKFHNNNGIIIGVVKDFHFASLRETIQPLIFYFEPLNSRLYVKTTGKSAPAAIKAVEKVWKKYNGGTPFDYAFLDDVYNRMYKSDLRTGILFDIFTGIAILISCLGLFGLATYSANVKVKEIGIRKVLGASALNIAMMLSKEFLVLVTLSIIIATPIAWYGTNQWLLFFAYRTHVAWWIFLVAGIGSLFITLLTISFQAIRAALANPVRSLRNE